MQRVSTSTAVAELPLPPDGGTPGYFAKPDPLNNVPATIPRYDWFNGVQEEIMKIIEASGQEPSMTDLFQLFKALSLPGVFQTAPQFDSSSRMATTEFVQNAIGGFGRSFGFDTSRTITPDQANSHINIFGTCSAITLPKTSEIPKGSMLYFCGTSLRCKITAATGDVIFGNMSNQTLPSIDIQPGGSLILVASKDRWFVSGSSALKFSDDFASFLTHAGWQKLPSGLIIQWGHGQFAAQPGNIQTITLPIAFPNNNFISMAFNESATGAGGSAAPPVVSAHSYTKTQISIQQHTNVAYTTYFSFLTIGN